MALLNFSLFCFVLYCYAFVQYCNAKTIQFSAMHKFVGVLDNPQKETLTKAKKLFKVSLLSLSKDSLVNFSGKASRISASPFSSSSVICVKIFKHGPYFLRRKGYDSVSISASFSFKQS